MLGRHKQLETIGNHPWTYVSARERTQGRPNLHRASVALVGLGRKISNTDGGDVMRRFISLMALSCGCWRPYKGHVS